MYDYVNFNDLQKSAALADTRPVVRYGVTVYVDTDPDWAGPDIYIDPADEKGMELFRNFARQVVDHYKTLKILQP